MREVVRNKKVGKILQARIGLKDQTTKKIAESRSTSSD